MEVRFDHVGLSVSNLAASAAFYEAAFGYREQLSFALRDTGIRGSMLIHASGHRLELFQHPAPAPGLLADTPIDALGTRGYGHFALACADIDVPFTRALAAGARSVLEPAPSPEPGVRFAFLADPEGNLVELVESPVLAGAHNGLCTGGSAGEPSSSADGPDAELPLPGLA